MANDNGFRDPVVTLSGAEMDLIACTEATCSEEGFLFTFAGLIGGGGAGIVSSRHSAP